MLSLLVGVLGMGLYHLNTEESPSDGVETLPGLYFTGIYNSAGPEPPTGIGSMPLPTGEACFRFMYNSAGQLQNVVYMASDGKPCLIPGSRVASQIIDYDTEGRVIAKRNIDVAGNPAPDAHDVATREFTYDASGHLSSVVTKGTDGKKIVPKMPGFAEQRLTYDSQNRPLEVYHLDGLGNPVTNSAGENHVRYRYDDEHHVTTRTNYQDGAVSDNVLGVAVERVDGAENGCILHKKWFDQNGQPAIHPEIGAASVLLVRSMPARTQRTQLCGADGLPLADTRGCAEHLLRTDSQGRPVWECYNAADGSPCCNPALGYAEHAWEYGADGQLRREYFWNAAGLPSSCYEKRYCGHGEHRYVLSLHTDGTTQVQLLSNDNQKETIMSPW